MGFFDKLKASVGIGQPKIEIKVTGTQFKRSDPIKGQITLTGKTKEVPVDSINVEFVEARVEQVWSDTLKKYVDEKKEQVVGKVNIPKGKYILKPEEVITEPFEMIISHAMVSGHPWSHKIKASADLPGLDPRTSVEIFVVN